MNVQIPISKGTAARSRAWGLLAFGFGLPGFGMVWSSAFPSAHYSAMAEAAGEEGLAKALRHFGFVIHSSFVIRVSSFELWFRH